MASQAITWPPNHPHCEGAIKIDLHFRPVAGGYDVRWEVHVLAHDARTITEVICGVRPHSGDGVLLMARTPYPDVTRATGDLFCSLALPIDAGGYLMVATQPGAMICTATAALGTLEDTDKTGV